MAISWPNQNAHMLFSAVILLIKALWMPVLFSTWWAVGLLVAWALVKELVWDARIEKSQGVGGAATDAGFYLIGLIGTALSLYLTGKF